MGKNRKIYVRASLRKVRNIWSSMKILEEFEQRRVDLESADRKFYASKNVY